MSVQRETTTALPWPLANQRYLMAKLERLRIEIECYLASQEEEPDEALIESMCRAAQAAVDDAASAMPAQPALATLCAAFGLSLFERDLLLLCAGIELDHAFATFVASIQGDSPHRHVTFSLAMAVLPNAEWHALSPAAALRYWRLIDVGPGAALTASPLRIAERVVHFLAGADYLDDQLKSRVQPAVRPGDLVPTQRALAKQTAAIWAQADVTTGLPVIQLCGTERMDKLAVAISACERLGLDLYVMPARAMPTVPNDLEVFARLWAREVALSRWCFSLMARI